MLDRLRKGKHLMRDEKLARLSRREERILGRVADGQTNREIGEELHLAEKTVKDYVCSLLSKLEVARRAEAAAYLARHTTTPGSAGYGPEGPSRGGPKDPCRRGPSHRGSTWTQATKREVGSMQTIERSAAGIPEIERLEPVHTQGLQRVFGLMRLAMGWTFLWAFLDKAFALGFSTGRDPQTGVVDYFGKAAWIHGGSPTRGVFAYALNAGWFTNLYERLGHVTVTAQGPTAGPSAWIDVLYMVSMLLIGLGLITGVMTRLAAMGGLIWVGIFFTATAIWPEHNPFLDEHVLEALILVGLVLANAGRYYGLGKVWQRFGPVRNRKYLY